MVNASSHDHWVKCILTEGHLRGVAIEATGLIQGMVDRHKLKGIAARGLGEAVMGALLIASYCKPGQRINLNVQGSGFFQQALVDAYPDGTVRGYVIEREAPLNQYPEENIGPWGTGLLSVLRTKDEEGEKPYIGTVPLITGHLAKDLTFYWVQSEQVPSAVGLSVNIEGDRVVSAGGFLVQALAGAHSFDVKMIEKHIREIQSLSETLSKNESPIHLLSLIFQSTPFIVVEEKPLQFKCRCSWERVQRALALIGEEELRAMLLEDGVAEVRCDFCAQEYLVTREMLEKLIQGDPASNS